jgi:hypothetical protein
MKKIKFIPNVYFIDSSEKTVPKSTSKTLPGWFLDAKRYIYRAKPATPDNLEKIASWKACPALYDAFSSGYFLKTPCDIEVTIRSDGTHKLEVVDKRFLSFVKPRGIIEGFQVPHGYSSYHFVWLPEWDIELPEGYSAMYLNPLNRFDLPFLSTSGIMDNDSANFSGHLPFFIRSEWSGVIEAGTPYIQVMPFKREDWESQVLKPDPIKDRFNKHSRILKKLRSKVSGVYASEFWKRRKYL